VAAWSDFTAALVAIADAAGFSVAAAAAAGCALPTKAPGCCWQGFSNAAVPVAIGDPAVFLSLLLLLLQAVQ
jgi:hypothetical protein